MQKVSGIQHADCLDFLSGVPDNSVDLVLTDYPYFISKKTGFKNGGGKQFDRIKISMDFGKWDRREHNQLDLAKVTAELYRVLRRGGTAIAFYDLFAISELKNWMETSGFCMLRAIEWLKTNPVPLNQRRTYLSGAREMALVGVKKGSPVFNGKYDRGVYEFPIARAKKGEDRHPTQKPVALFEALIEKHTSPGSTVLDCFLGSGTTAVAAINTGRSIIGCELDATHYRNMIRRVLPLTLSR